MRKLFRCLAATLVCAPLAVAAHDPAFGQTELVAHVPAPGFPEGIAVDGDRVLVAGPATFDNFGQLPSTVWQFDRQGRLRRTTEVPGNGAPGLHGLSGVALDRAGRLYVLDVAQGVVRIDRDGAQSLYATVPFLPGSFASLLNDCAFDDDGNLYITDSLQGVLFRVPPGGGAATVWFADPRLQTPFGPNGIRLDPARKHVYFDVTLPTGVVYRLPLVDHPGAGDLETVHAYAGEGPDNLVFGAGGRIYVALALSNQISILDPGGAESARISTASGPVPIDAPAGLAFDGHGWLLFTNHAEFSGVADHMAVMRSFVDDRGDRLSRPRLDGDGDDGDGGDCE